MPNSSACGTRLFGARYHRLDRVKTGKAQTEQMFSGLCLKSRRKAFMWTRLKG
jgi:hypothetical protein